MTPGPPARPVQIKITCCICLQVVHSTARPCWGRAAACNLRGHREPGSVTLTHNRHQMKMKIQSKKCQSWAKPIANRTRSSQINRSPSIERFASACKFLWTFRTCFNRMTILLFQLLRNKNLPKTSIFQETAFDRLNQWCASLHQLVSFLALFSIR